jgi:hypothetical protein
VVKANRASALLSDAMQCRHQYRQQYGDNSDNDQEFYQCKSSWFANSHVILRLQSKHMFPAARSGAAFGFYVTIRVLQN